MSVHRHRRRDRRLRTFSSMYGCVKIKNKNKSERTGQPSTRKGNEPLKIKRKREKCDGMLSHASHRKRPNTKPKGWKIKKKTYFNEKRKKLLGQVAQQQCTGARRAWKYNIDQVLHERMEKHENNIENECLHVFEWLKSILFVHYYSCYLKIITTEINLQQLIHANVPDQPWA